MLVVFVDHSNKSIHSYLILDGKGVSRLPIASLPQGTVYLLLLSESIMKYRTITYLPQYLSQAKHPFTFLPNPLLYPKPSPLTTFIFHINLPSSLDPYLHCMSDRTSYDQHAFPHQTPHGPNPTPTPQTQSIAGAQRTMLQLFIREVTEQPRHLSRYAACLRVKEDGEGMKMVYRII